MKYLCSVTTTEVVVTTFSIGGETPIPVRVKLTEGTYQVDHSYAGAVVYHIPLSARGTITVGGDIWFIARGLATRLAIGSQNGTMLPESVDDGWAEDETPEGLADGVGWHWNR